MNAEFFPTVFQSNHIMKIVNQLPKSPNSHSIAQGMVQIFTTIFKGSKEFATII